MGADRFFRQLALAQPGRPGQAILTGLLCGAAGLAVRAMLQPLFGGASGLTVLLPAVLIAALWGGRFAGYAAIIVSIVGAVALTQLAGGLIAFNATSLAVGVASFIFAGLFGTVLGASLRSTLRDLDDTVSRLRASDSLVDETTSELRAMVEQASAGIARVGLNGKIISSNARFAEILGLRPDQAVGITTGDVTHPDDIALTRSALDAARAGGDGTIEKRYLRPDGSTVWALTSLRALTSPTAEPMGFIAVVVDITAAKAAEAALRESESRFRLMADTAPSPVWMTNAHAEVEFVNKALVEFYGRPAEHILGSVWRQSVHPDDVAEMTAVMEVARPGHHPYGFEARFLRFDNDWRWMRIAVNPRFDAAGAFLGYVGMSFDITETRNAMQALEAQERRQTFLLSLTDRLRDLTTPDDIMAEVERSLGDELGADRVGYGEVDQERGLVSMSRDWTTGAVSAQGQFSLGELGADLISDLAEGRLIRIADVRKDKRTRGALQAFERLGTRALMRAPLHRGGRLRAFLYVHNSTVREWTDAEAKLLQEVGRRTWTEIERARAEGAVRESEERFRAIADTAPVLIWVTGADRVREFVNQAYVAYNGGSYEEARLADWRAVIHVDDHERIIQDSIAGEATGQPFSMEARYLRHDGEYRWLKSFSRPRLDADGEVIGFVGVAFDVTDIREAQARLTESETRFRTVADSAPAQMWMTDETGAVVFANRRYRTFFGVRRDEDLQANWAATMSANGLEAFHSGFLTALAQRDRYEGIMEIVHPQMGRRWLRCEGIPRFDGAGHFQGYVGANIDITEARQAEEDLKRINELLEERVSEAMAEKAKAEADLMHAQRMEAVGRLTGGVAHDFNNLLTVVIGALDMMLRSPTDLARQKKLGEAALAAARRGEGLTHQLLAFSRRQALRPESLDLNGLIRESEPLLRRAVGEAVEFKLKLRRGGARVNVDPSQFEAALLNLVVNARDAVGDKGGRITVQTQSCKVRGGDVPELPAGDYVCVTVSDNGSGIDPEVISRVFEPFFTTKAIGKGTGLGLSQVYGFARQSGGGVRIASTPGRGSEIRLYLPPLDRLSELETVERGISPYPQVATRRILLVEDDPGVAAIALDLLTAMGMDVATADTGPRALEMLQVEGFDLMLSDIAMPGGMTGIELARECAKKWPDMRIVLTSGYAGEDVDEALSDAPWPFLRKPYSGAQLADILGQVPARAE
ncbi:PAS domain S-box protein [Brevundimonas sp.]|uniref:PAS domain S-box protein n=1 Tax=Brevundimonas sp. TaxID=1871086 RepID=UPI0025C3B04E|nr:PAS domain S-box protein [Brevundimonas sp.]